MSKNAGERNSNSNSEADAARASWISELARADAGRLSELWRETGLAPDFQMLRAPETGLVMTRGRAGGDGAAFNLGEATVTRCSVRLATGEEGHAYALGRDKAKARVAAICDALMQTALAERLTRDLLAPLARERAEREAALARKVDPTRVEFFTMTRGEN